MLKKLALLVLLLLFIQANENIQKLENSILRLDTYKGQNVFASGTSFYVGNDIFITNYHVVSHEVENPQEYKTFILTGFTNGKIDKKPVSILDYSKDSDLALVKVVGLNKHPLILSIVEDIYTSKDVYAIGYPVSSDNDFNENLLKATSTKGIISKLDKFNLGYTPKKVKMIITDTTMNPGNSGGPLVDKCGNLVGINESKFTSKVKSEDNIDNVYFAVHISELIELLKKNNISYTIANEKCLDIKTPIKTSLNYIWLVVIIIIGILVLIINIFTKQNKNKINKDELSKIIKNKLKANHKKEQKNILSITLLSKGDYPPLTINANQVVMLGRSDSNDFVIQNRYISSNHLKLHYNGKSIYVIENSKNGTYIDDMRLKSNKKYLLESNRVLYLGSKDVAYMIDKEYKQTIKESDEIVKPLDKSIQKIRCINCSAVIDKSKICHECGFAEHLKD